MTLPGSKNIGAIPVFRSVKESRHLSAKRRWLYRAEGLAVAGLGRGLGRGRPGPRAWPWPAWFALVILGFAWLLSAPG